jgi:hypothetical protein
VVDQYLGAGQYAGKGNREAFLLALENAVDPGNSVAEKERVLMQDPAQGAYVLRVINFASATPSWTLTASLFDADTTTVPGLVENWTLTCERDGHAMKRVPVVIDRGQQLAVDLTACGG